jgi:aldose 1-epimerase
VRATYDCGPTGLRVTLEADTDRPTVVNLVQHAYVNLAGHAAGSVFDHELTLAADLWTPADEDLLTTGEVCRVAGTAYDFRAARPIRQGYDNNWVLRGPTGELHDAAVLRDPGSGRVLRWRTTEPGVQVYTAGSLPDGTPGKGGVQYGRYGGIAVETQRFPCSPNHPHFPSAVVRPGVPYRHEVLIEASDDGSGV